MKRRALILLLVLPLVAACSAQTTGPTGSSPVAAHAAATPIPTPTPTPTPTPPALSLASIFGTNKPDLSMYDPSQLRVIIATGDVIPAREVNYQTVIHHDWLYPWRQTADDLKTGDLLFINLESPLIKNCPIIHGGFKFCGDARAIAGLDYAGVNVANLANNHLTNFGPAGTNETQILLAKHGIGMSGLGLNEIRDIRGIKFAFLGFNGVGTHIDRAEMKREIDLVRPLADVVVVAFHWGKEYELLPVAAAGIAPDNPREIGHLAIDDGADLVIGNHPHWVQPVEIYKDHLITYAHGNFIFDQMWSTETREGVVGRYTFYGTRLVRVDYRPLLIENYAQPRWLDDTTGLGKAIIDRMAQGSAQLAGG
ncbi:MAG TPA: CapA family protein [Candidatus Dormibacteraeota bacterium]|nr:CapA family protein [Candidatus Dormibacteraeota bacterium]